MKEIGFIGFGSMGSMLEGGMMELEKIRRHIDDLDSMIITLLAKRADMVGAAGKFKKDAQSVRDPKRVDQVIEKVRAKALSSGLSPEIAEIVYRTIIECFIDKELLEFNQRSAKEA